MNKFINSVKKFVVSEDGPTAVEYAVMLALIIVVCLAAITTIVQLPTLSSLQLVHTCSKSEAALAFWQSVHRPQQAIAGELRRQSLFYDAESI